MKLNTFSYFVKDAGLSFKRNKALSVSSAGTVTATLFILGIFILAMLNVNIGLKDVEARLEIKAFMQDEISSENKTEIEDLLASSTYIKSYEEETKEQALVKLRKQLGEDGEMLTEGYDEKNPLPNSYVIRVKNASHVDDVVKSLQGLEGIQEIKDGKEVVDLLVNVTSTAKWVGIILLVILVGVSLFLIGNTIKLSVYSRRKEIGIMKYIGATDWFIRWPFILEGAFIGFIGAFIGDLILFFGYRYIFNKISESFIISSLLKPNYILTTMMPYFIFLGILIGCIGSIISIKKYLSV
ncbi:MAG: permease-like cell division protein FtsX [Clostridiaceae bacterium]